MEFSKSYKISVETCCVPFDLTEGQRDPIVLEKFSVLSGISPVVLWWERDKIIGKFTPSNIPPPLLIVFQA